VSEIILTNGLVTLVEEQDSLFFNQWSWNPLYCKNTIYSYRTTGPRGQATAIMLHREIIERTGIILGSSRVDHNGLNNLRSNLRIASDTENARNKRIYSNNTSGYKGVIWSKTRNNWVARITYNGEKINLGHYKLAISAAIAYNHHAKQLFGEFAWLNEIEEK
jgi:hypothetical protein